MGSENYFKATNLNSMIQLETAWHNEIYNKEEQSSESENECKYIIFN